MLNWIKEQFLRPEPLVAQRIAEPEERPDDEYTWWAVTPSRMYPATLRVIEYCLKTQQIPAGQGQYYAEAQRLPAEAWRWARVHRDQVPAEHLPTRAAALDLARRWFIEALHQETGAPIGVHILAEGDSHWCY